MQKAWEVMKEGRGAMGRCRWREGRGAVVAGTVQNNEQ